MSVNEFSIGPASIFSDVIGKYVIVRSRNEGVNFGKVIAADSTGCVVGEVIRLHYHKPQDSNSAWYEGVANTGLDESSDVSVPVECKYIIEDYSFTLCTEVAIASIKSHKPNGSK